MSCPCEKPNFYIVNGCGEMFLFKDVPENVDFEEWFEYNDIKDIVMDSCSDCSYGFLSNQSLIDKPQNGWITTQDSDEEATKGSPAKQDSEDSE